MNTNYKKIGALGWKQSSLFIILMSKYDFPPDLWKTWHNQTNGNFTEISILTAEE